MDDVRRDLHHLAGFDDQVLIGRDELELAFHKEGDLLVLMVMIGHDGALFQFQAGDSDPVGVNGPAGQSGTERFQG